MTFTVQGVLSGQRVTVEVEDDPPRFEGDVSAVTLCYARLADEYPLLQTPEGPEHAPALTPDYVAWMVVRDALDSIYSTDPMPVFPHEPRSDDAV